MAKTKIKVTELELSILQQIWGKGNSASVSDVIESWPSKKRPGYTTILKTLQKMEAKDIVGHRQDGKRYLYFSKLSKEQISGGRLGSIIGRIFSGNPISFAQYFLNSTDFNLEEIRELKKLVAQKEKELKQ